MVGSMGVLFVVGAPLFGAVNGIFWLLQGMSKAGLGVKDLVPKRLIIFVSMIVVCATYGLIAALILSQKSGIDNAVLCAGYIIGVSTFCVQSALGIFGGAAAQSIVQQPRLFVVAVLGAIFIEAIALYSFIVGLVCVKNAQKYLQDMAPDEVIPFASVSILANIGSAIGSLASGVAIMGACVEYPQFAMRLTMSLVMAGNLGIYGLICAVIGMGAWPPTESGFISGGLFLFSGLLHAYVVQKGIPMVPQDPTQFVKLLTNMIGCAAPGFLGLVLFIVQFKPPVKKDPAGYELIADPGASLGSYNILLVTSTVVFVISVGVSFTFGAHRRFVVHAAPLLG